MFIIFLLLCVLAIGALLYFTPILRPFPQPSGPYGVGVTTKQFVDSDRQEIHNPTSKRELVVDFYYPTDKVTPAQLYPYKPAYTKALIDVYAQHTWIPHFIIRQLLSGGKSYANPNGTIASGSFPVILFSHGIGGDPNYSVYLEELASHGYIIAAVYHTYDMEVTVFPDGRIIELSAELRDMIDKNDRSRIYPYRGQAHKIWLQDLQFLIAELSSLNENPDSLFYKKLDLSKIGAMGHSHGGGVVIDLVKNDNRVKAGIDMDGWTRTANSTQAFNKPFMTLVTNSFILDEPFTGGLTGWDVFLKNMQKNKDAHLVRIPGSNHGSFTDDIQTKWPLGMRAAKANTTRKWIQSIIRKFFDKYLKDNL